MADSAASQGRPVKKIKLAGRDFSGKIPKVFLDNGIVKLEFHIHGFADLKQKRGERYYTGSINAHDHLWKLWIDPQGSNTSNADVEHVSIYLVYDGKNTKTDPVFAKGRIWTKTINQELSKNDYSNEKESFGWADFGKREDMIKKDCNEAGTLTVAVELQVATENRSVWYPRLTYSCGDIGVQLYDSIETSDITFIVGASEKEFFGHKCIFFHRARVWYELILTEESSSSSSSSENNNCIIILPDVDEKVFEVILRFVYTGDVPKLNKDDDDDDEETMKSILITGNRLGVTELKLYVESVLVEHFLIPSSAATLLLLADSHICALLKEGAMDLYASKSMEVIESNLEEWTKLKESNNLLVELFVYASSGRHKYSSVVDDGNGTLDDANDFDVTSLRERLQRYDLDVDGSRDMLLDRWKMYLRANDNKVEEDVDVEEEEEEEVVVVEEEEDEVVEAEVEADEEEEEEIGI